MARSAHARVEAPVVPAPGVRPRRETGRPSTPSARAHAESRGATLTPRVANRRISRLPARVLVFVACLAVLAAGRVTLSFAVVQKNIQTDAVVSEYRGLDAENAQLSEQAAGLSSSLAVRDIAVHRYHLTIPDRVEYITVPPRVIRKLEAGR